MVKKGGGSHAYVLERRGVAGIVRCGAAAGAAQERSSGCVLVGCLAHPAHIV